jgi:hypothetical protein
MLLDVNFDVVSISGTIEYDFSGFIVAGVGFVVTIILFFVCDRTIVNKVPVGVTFLIVVFPMLFGLIFASWVLFSSAATQSNDNVSVVDKQVVSLQSWVSDKYLVDLDDTQAVFLLENQVDLTDEDMVDVVADSLLVRDGYGDLVEVQLVKVADSEWKLIKDNVEVVGVN